MSFSGFGDRNLFESNAALQYKVHALERIVEEFKTGKRYLKLQNDYHRVIAGYIKEIKRLRKELADAHAQSIEVRRIWTDECNHVWEENQSEISKKNEEIRKLEDTVWETRRELDEKVTRLTMEYEDKIREKDCIIDELKNRLAHAEALLGRDSTNTNTPTSQTPPGKNKHIPNSRRGQGKKKGGQFGHEKHTLEKPPAEEITDEIDHFLEAGMSCPSCGSENLPGRNTGEGCHFLPLGDFPDVGIEPESPAVAGVFIPTEPSGKPFNLILLFMSKQQKKQKATNPQDLL